MQTLQSSFHEMTPELSWKMLSSQSTSAWISRVGCIMWVLNRESIVESSPVTLSVCLILAAKILCEQCSDQVCARHSSSASVGRSGGRPVSFLTDLTRGSR